MSSIEQNIYQSHSGPGDNVRDKYVYQIQSIAPDNLQKPIELILSDIREKNPISAKIRLETIKAANSLNKDSEMLLDSLSFHLDILEENEKIRLHSALISYTSHPPINSIYDLCFATLIRLEAERNLSDDARERYKRIEQPGPFSNEAFYELVADIDELKGVFDKNIINLTEGELNGLIRGFLRAENSSLALTSAKRLESRFPSFNSRVLRFIAESSILINEQLQKTCYWTITATLKRNLLALIKELVSLINESNGQDKRLFDVAAVCLKYTFGSDKSLEGICWKYVDQLEEKHQDVAAQLHNIYAGNPSKIKDEFLINYVKAERDKEYREQLLTEITSAKEISTEKFIILKNFERKRISQWAKKGGVVVAEDEIDADLWNLQLRLIALSENNNRTDIENTRLEAENFIEKNKDKLTLVNPVILVELADSLLLHPELTLIASNLVKPLLPVADFWASPIVKSYLNSLLISEQTATLTSELKNINESEWDCDIWLIQSLLQEQTGNYAQATESVDIALELNSNDLDAWYCLIRLHRKLDRPDDTLRERLKKIPDKALLKQSKTAFCLLIEIAKTGDFSRSERIILSWFIENPDACAMAMSNFNFALTLNEKLDLEGCEKVGDCVVGVVYTEDNVKHTKLLIDNQSIKHNCLLDINSPLGSILYELRVGEERQHGMHDYKLIERLPAYVAAFRISLDLRQIQNDGTDSFYGFQVPNDPDEMLAIFEEKLSRMQRSDNADIFENPDIPIYFKGYLSHRNDPLKAAFELLSTNNIVKNPLPNFGNSSPTKAILDVYGIAYLALTGFAFGINNTSTKFIISAETKYFVEEWIKDINREDYLTLGIRPGGGLFRVTAEDIKNSVQHRMIEDAIELILSECEVINPGLTDIPPLLLRIHGIIDDSVYSSIKLSISNNIPWLSIDGILPQFIHDSDLEVVNALVCFTRLGETLSFEHKKEGLYLHAMECLPYAITYQDLIMMSGSNDEHAHYFLSKLIRLYPHAFADTVNAVGFYSDLLVRVLGKAYFDGEILNGLRIQNPRNNGYAERVFNACCFVSIQCNDDIKAEAAFAMLICKLIEKLPNIPRLIRIISSMATAFANGHFLSIPTINQNISNINSA
ncbi:tetratricopeptide repeat protein [Methylomonas sp. MS20]|uniref:tetratricopeptide repeat protein n=1 Tax=Methylomonas sp. MS20 TaxID=3418769 RepID=UPI003CFCA4BF